MRVGVFVTIFYETDVPDDPSCYEGAATPEERIEKERQYLTEGGDYLFQALQHEPHTVKVQMGPVGSSLVQGAERDG